MVSVVCVQVGNHHVGLSRIHLGKLLVSGSQRLAVTAPVIQVAKYKLFFPFLMHHDQCNGSIFRTEETERCAPFPCLCNVKENCQ